MAPPSRLGTWSSCPSSENPRFESFGKHHDKFSWLGNAASAQVRRSPQDNAEREPERLEARGWGGVPLRRWAQMLPACIQVCPVELPGRGRRRGEEGISDVAALADVLAESLPMQVRRTLLPPMPCRFPAGDNAGDC